jgi:uncharacterized protein (DUF3084 family)
MLNETTGPGDGRPGEVEKADLGGGAMETRVAVNEKLAELGDKRKAAVKKVADLRADLEKARVERREIEKQRVDLRKKLKAMPKETKPKAEKPKAASPKKSKKGGAGKPASHPSPAQGMNAPAKETAATAG